MDTFYVLYRAGDSQLISAVDAKAALRQSALADVVALFVLHPITGWPALVGELLEEHRLAEERDEQFRRDVAACGLGPARQCP